MIVRRGSAALLLLLASGCAPGPATLQAEAVREPRAVTSTRAIQAAPHATSHAAPHATSHAAPALPRGCSRRAVACVSTHDRLAWIQYGGKASYGPVRVGLGRASQPTPHGRFRVAWKDEEHTSSTYGIDMPYSVFFASGGIAFHEGPVDEPSHGCVHLPAGAAAAFFAALERGDRVEVF